MPYFFKITEKTRSYLTSPPLKKGDKGGFEIPFNLPFGRLRAGSFVKGEASF
jgi:hypothetical protein